MNEGQIVHKGEWIWLPASGALLNLRNIVTITGLTEKGATVCLADGSGFYARGEEALAVAYAVARLRGLAA